MILFFSGNAPDDFLPERVLAEHNPAVMLSFYDLAFRARAMNRLLRHERRCRAKWRKQWPKRRTRPR